MEHLSIVNMPSRAGVQDAKPLGEETDMSEIHSCTLQISAMSNCQNVHDQAILNEGWMFPSFPLHGREFICFLMATVRETARQGMPISPLKLQALRGFLLESLSLNETDVPSLLLTWD